MIVDTLSLISRAFGVRAALALGCVAAVSLAACGKGGAAGESRAQTSSPSKAGSVSMCKLMPKEEVNASIGSAYTISEQSDQRSGSSCHYSSGTDPAGMSLDLHWIEPADYSSPAQHAALQSASMGGAKLGGKLTGSMIPDASEGDGPIHIHSGPVNGIGDEALQNMLLLTARKGDYVLMVQIIADPMRLMQDSTAGPQLLENERKLARAVLAKI